MKVFFDHQIFSYQRYGGISRYFSQLFAEYIAHPEMNCEIFCPMKYNLNVYLKELKINRASQIKKTNFWKTWLGFFLNQRLSERVFRQADFDLIHPTFYHPYLLKGRNKPLVCTIHDMTPERFPEEFNQSLYHKIVTQRWIRAKKEMASQADAIIAVSENTKKDIVEIYGLPSDKITVIHSGYTPLTDRQENKKQIMQEPYILYVGIRKGYKNFPILVKAFANWVKRYPEFHLLCVGGGQFSEEEKEIIAKYRLQNKVWQRNLTDQELAAAYMNAGFFVFPSKYEGFGLPILEAFAYDCPVILARSSCFPEIAGEAALYFNPDSEEELVIQMTQLAESEMLRQKLQRAGAERLKAFDWKKTAEETVQIYRKVLDCRKI